MTKFTPYEKLSKKAKKTVNNSRRANWNGVNPVTRRSENPRAYNRAKTKRLITAEI